MKKKLVVNCICGLMLLALVQCGTDGPEHIDFSPIPAIKFNKLKFIEVGGPADYDTLKLTISYWDGDSNLGLSPIDREDFAYPFHDVNYFLEDGTGDTIPVLAELIDNSWRGINSIPQNGMLVTDATREKPNYEYLPEYDPYSCVNYSYNTEFLVRKNLNIVDESFDIRDTLTIDRTDYIKIWEPLLFSLNENHYNILVDFYFFNGVEFERFDWFAEYCMIYHGRFPLILDKPSGTIKSGHIQVNVKSQWEGKIIYSMPGTSFPAVFGEDTRLKLAITIKDRALNTSNTVVTPEFTLAGIK